MAEADIVPLTSKAKAHTAEELRASLFGRKLRAESIGLIDAQRYALLVENSADGFGSLRLPV
jgi:hypothetical protein